MSTFSFSLLYPTPEQRAQHMTAENRPTVSDETAESLGLADRVLYTGCIDEYFDYCYGELEYRSLRFETEELEEENYQGNAVINYTDAETPFTRIIEHKHFE